MSEGVEAVKSLGNTDLYCSVHMQNYCNNYLSCSTVVSCG